jgi:hypothetical protein
LTKSQNSDKIHSISMKHWTEEYLVPLYADRDMVEKANQYDDPQSAWDAWDNGGELLWILARTGANRSQRTLCVCDIAERVLHIFEENYPDDKRPRKAIVAARRYAENPNEENRVTAKDAANAIYHSTNTTVGYAARAAADAAACSSDADAVYVTNGCNSTVVYAARAAGADAASTVCDTDADTRYAVDIAARAAEQKAQADIVRKYFPVSPFCKSVS